MGVVSDSVGELPTPGRVPLDARHPIDLQGLSLARGCVAVPSEAARLAIGGLSLESISRVCTLKWGSSVTLLAFCVSLPSISSCGSAFGMGAAVVASTLCPLMSPTLVPLITFSSFPFSSSCCTSGLSSSAPCPQLSPVALVDSLTSSPRICSSCSPCDSSFGMGGGYRLPPAPVELMHLLDLDGVLGSTRILQAARARLPSTYCTSLRQLESTSASHVHNAMWTSSLAARAGTSTRTSMFHLNPAQALNLKNL